MDQCQKIQALHSLVGHGSCQPVCVLQLAAPVPKPCQRTAHYASKVPTFRMTWSFHQHFPSREEKLHMPPCLSQQNKGSLLFFAIHLWLQNGGGRGGMESCLSFAGSLAYNTYPTCGYSPSPGEASLTKGEQSSTWDMLPRENFPMLSFSFLPLNVPI